jgi:hypothetical protein
VDNDELGDAGQRAHIGNNVGHEECALWEVGERLRISEGHSGRQVEALGRLGRKKAQEIGEAFLQSLLHQLIVRDPRHWAGLIAPNRAPAT